MNVVDHKDLGEGHLIEFGFASWDENGYSVRNRYPTKSGGFSPHSSSEIPMDDLALLVQAAAERDVFATDEMITMIKSLADALERDQSGDRKDIFAGQ